MKKFLFTVISFLLAYNIFKPSIFASDNSLILESSQEPSIYSGHHSHCSHASHYSSRSSDGPNYRDRLKSFLSSPSLFYSNVQSYFAKKGLNVDCMSILPAQEINVIGKPFSGSVLIITLSDGSDMITQFYVPFEGDKQTFFWETSKNGFHNNSGRSPDYLESCDFDDSLFQYINTEINNFQKQNLPK